MLKVLTVFKKVNGVILLRKKKTVCEKKSKIYCRAIGVWFEDKLQPDRQSSK